MKIYTFKQELIRILLLALPMLLYQFLGITQTQSFATIVAICGTQYIIARTVVNTLTKLQYRFIDMAVNMHKLNKPRVKQEDYNKLLTNVLSFSIIVLTLYNIFLIIFSDFYISLFNFEDKQVINIIKIWLYTTFIYNTMYSIAKVYENNYILEERTKESTSIMSVEVIIQILGTIIIYYLFPQVSIASYGLACLISETICLTLYFKRRPDMVFRFSYINIKWIYKMAKEVFPIFVVNLTGVLDAILVSPIIALFNPLYLAGHTIRVTLSDLVNRFTIVISEMSLARFEYGRELNSLEQIKVTYKASRFLGLIIGTCSSLAFLLVPAFLSKFYITDSKDLMYGVYAVKIYAPSMFLVSVYITTTFAVRGLGIVKIPANTASTFVMLGILSSFLFKQDTVFMYNIYILLETIKHLIIWVYIEYKMKTLTLKDIN